MIYLIVGFFTGGFVSLVMYSTISPGFAKAIYMQMKELGWL